MSEHSVTKKGQLGARVGDPQRNQENLFFEIGSVDGCKYLDGILLLSPQLNLNPLESNEQPVEDGVAEAVHKLAQNDHYLTLICIDYQRQAVEIQKIEAIDVGEDEHQSRKPANFFQLSGSYVEYHTRCQLAENKHRQDNSS